MVTVVFLCSTNCNLQGWSSNKMRALHIRYSIWRTYTIRLAVALLVEEHRNTIPACLRGVLLSGMLMSDQRWISWCTLSDGKRNYVPHTWYRAFILNSLMQFLLRQKTPRYMNMEILLGCYPPPVANVLCGGCESWTASIACCNFRWSINCQFKWPWQHPGESPTYIRHEDII